MALVTRSPGPPAVLFDGRCAFCRGSVDRLRRLAPGDEVQWRSFREPGALDAFPGVTAQACERAMQFVRADGRVFAGIEAIVQVLALRSAGKLAMAYYTPGLRQIADAVYALVARNRFRIGGAACDDGSCRIHRNLLGG